MEYKVINGYSKYLINEYGDIISNQRKNQIHIKTQIAKNGYETCILIDDNGERKSKLVHRLVAETFLPNEENKPCINHINSIRDDNRLCNLEWCTMLENNSTATAKYHKSLKGREKAKILFYGYHNVNTPIIQYDYDGNLIQVWDNIDDAAQALNLNKKRIFNCMNGKAKHTGGYKFDYYTNANYNNALKKQKETIN